jgi:hypothetical protein
MTIIGVIAVVAAFLALARYGEVSGDRVLLLGGAFVIWGPLYYSLREGNTTHFILLVLVGMAWCIRAGLFGWAGVLLAAATLIKPPLGLIALPFLLRQRWSFVGTFVATGAIVGGASLAAYGLDLHREWYDYAVRPYSEHPLGAENVQSLDATLARFWTDDYLDRFVPIQDLGAGFEALRNSIAVALLALAAWVVWRGRRDGGDADIVDACIALCLALMITPTSWTHYYTLLLLPVGLMIAGSLGLAWTRLRVAAVALGVMLIAPPVVFVAPDYPLLSWLVPRVLISHYFYGAFVIMCVLLEYRWHAGSRSGSSEPEVVPVPERAPEERERVLVASRLRDERMPGEPAASA